MTKWTDLMFGDQCPHCEQVADWVEVAALIRYMIIQPGLQFPPAANRDRKAK